MLTDVNLPSAGCPQKAGLWRPPRHQWSGYMTGENEHATVLLISPVTALWQRESHCCHMRSRLQFSRRHVVDSEAIWKRVLWSSETTIELFAHQSKCHVWRKLNKKCASSEKNYWWQHHAMGMPAGQKRSSECRKIGGKPNGVCKTPVTWAKICFPARQWLQV